MKSQNTLDLNEIIQHPGKKLKVELETHLEKEEFLETTSSLKGYLEAVSTSNLLLLKGQFETACILDCARCLTPLEQEIRFEIDEQFDVEGIPAGYGTGGYAKVQSDEPFPIFEENALLVSAFLRQVLLINLPLQPLCSYGWDGPCPRALQIEAMLKKEKSFSKLQELKNLLMDSSGAEENAQ